MTNVLQSFKKKVLFFRYGFELQEKRLKYRADQQTRRSNYKYFMKRAGASEEVIEYSMNEFIPLDRGSLVKATEKRITMKVSINLKEIL